MKKNKLLISIIINLSMWLLTIVIILPFYLMIIMGTYKTNALFKKIHLLPGDYFLNNFITLINKGFTTFFGNSFYIAFIATIGTLIICSMAGYAFAKFSFSGKKFLFNMSLAVMMIPYQLGLIAFVWQMKQFNWTGTHLPLIIPPMANSFGVFWMTQYIKTVVPSEVIESARIDGCGEFRIFYNLVLDFIKPALLSLGLLVFLWNWNNFLIPLVILNKPNLFTIPLGLALLEQLYTANYGAQILSLSISIIPILLFFGFFSKYLVRGMVSGALKG